MIINNSNGNSEDVTPVGRGGTGGTTAKEAQFNLLNDMSLKSDALADTDYMPILQASPSKTDGVLAKIKMSTLWTYVQNRINSVLGLNATRYDGTSTKAVEDSEGNIIVQTYVTKDDIKWIPLGSVSGTTEKLLPDNWKELKMVLSLNNGAGAKFPVDFIREMLNVGNNMVSIGGGCNNAGTGIYRGRLFVTESAVSIERIYGGAMDNPSDVLSTTNLYIWYR